LPDARTGIVRVSDQLPAGAYSVQVIIKDAGGVIQPSDAFTVQVLPVGRASEVRPASFAYPNDARYYGLRPAEGLSLAGLYDRATSAVFTITADMPLDAAQYRFASATRANRCHIELAAQGMPDTILTFVINGGQSRPFTVPLVSGEGVYDGDCGLPADYQTLQFTLTHLNGFDPGFFLQFKEFRLGYNGVDSP
jgi:hypothetical protein